VLGVPRHPLVQTCEMGVKSVLAVQRGASREACRRGRCMLGVELLAAPCSTTATRLVMVEFQNRFKVITEVVRCTLVNFTVGLSYSAVVDGG
jgi:hypothetical protein